MKPSRRRWMAKAILLRFVHRQYFVACCFSNLCVANHPLVPLQDMAGEAAQAPSVVASD